jgi:hypothetical protein
MSASHKLVLKASKTHFKHHCISVTLCKIIYKQKNLGFHLQILGVEKYVGHTATAAMGFVIRLIASNPSLAR